MNTSGPLKAVFAVIGIVLACVAVVAVIFAAVSGVETFRRERESSERAELRAANNVLWKACLETARAWNAHPGHNATCNQTGQIRVYAHGKVHRPWMDHALAPAPTPPPKPTPTPTPVPIEKQRFILRTIAEDGTATKVDYTDWVHACVENVRIVNPRHQTPYNVCEGFMSAQDPDDAQERFLRAYQPGGNRRLR